MRNDPTTPLRDADGKPVACISCGRTAVRYVPGPDGKRAGTCVTEAEGKIALDLFFSQLDRARMMAASYADIKAEQRR